MYILALPSLNLINGFLIEAVGLIMAVSFSFIDISASNECNKYPDVYIVGVFDLLKSEKTAYEGVLKG